MLKSTLTKNTYKSQEEPTYQSPTKADKASK